MNATPAKPRKSGGTSAAPKRQRAKRMPAEARKEVILAAASEFFARHGLEASTRDLADRIGVRQALLYKYFPSKEALIESVFDRLISERRDVPEATLSTQAAPLADRLFKYYEFIGLPSETSNTRLSIRAALEDLTFSREICAAVARGLTSPLVGELRREEGLPDVAARPLMPGETEAVMAFHAGALFLALRRHLRAVTVAGSADDAMKMQIAIFLSGFRKVLRELHADAWPKSLTDAPAA